MTKQLNIGFLGTGYMSGVHAGSLMKIDDVKISAVCSTAREKGVSFAKAYSEGSMKVYSDFYKMIDEVPLDILYICLPPFAHTGQLEAAAKKGINIFIEKPIALTAEHGESMASAVREAGVITQVGYHMRFGAAIKELKAMIDNGTAGLPTLFNGRYECNSLHSPWWIDENKSGGQVFEQVIHLYDLSMYLLGQPDRVTGYASNLCHLDVPGYTVEDTSVSAIKFRSGALANISGSNCAVPMQWNGLFTVVCQNVTAHFATPNKAEIIITKGDEVTTKSIDADSDMYFEENLSFINAVKGIGPTLAPIEDGLAGLKLVSAVMKSSKMDGTPVKLG